MRHEIKKFYPQEYALGQKAIGWIEKKTGIDLGDDEAAFIAMHIVSSEFETSEVSDVQKNALEKAKEYQETMSMSPETIKDQLTSEYGEKFTQEEADYAIANLPQQEMGINKKMITAPTPGPERQKRFWWSGR